MSLYLCVDCGGSKTAAVICNREGRVLGRALGGPSNFAYISLDAFISAVRTAIIDALRQFGHPCTNLPPTTESPFAAAWFGVSGVDSQAAIDAVTSGLSPILGIPSGPRLLITNDTHLLAAPARLLSDVSGAVAVIGGTGSIAVSFRKLGGGLEELGRIGGWGWILGDEGGGFHVGREAVRQILLDHDRASVYGPLSQQSTLARKILDRFGITDIMEILTIIHHHEISADAAGPDTPSYLLVPREKRLSSLSPLVFAAAFEDGDALAINVLRACASVLASEIMVLLGAGNTKTARTVKAQDSVISFGGSLVGVERYRKMILATLAEQGHEFKYVEFVDDAAVAGAVALAASLGEAGAQRN